MKYLLTVLLATASASHIKAQTVQEIVVPRGAIWRYLDDGSNQGTAWRANGFDDSSWAQGPAQLGYGDGDEATTLSFGGVANDRHITYYFRHEFTAPGAAGYAALNVRVLRDDGVAVYLNGAEIARNELPAGAGFDTLASATAADAEEENFFWFPVPPAMLNTGTNVLAVEVHQRAANSSDVSFDLELIGADREVVTRGPWLQLGTPSSTVVRWRTDLPTNGRVSYGLAPGALTSFVDDGILALDHEINVGGLLPSTQYYYAVGTTTDILAGGDVEHTFRTPPSVASVEPFRAWVIGDSGTAKEDARRVRDAYEAFTGATPTNLWLMLGDNAYSNGSIDEYQAAVFDTYPAMLRKSVLWTTRGNHENSTSAYTGLFTLPTAGEAGGLPSGTEAYYAFDWGNVHFVCLDSDSTDRSVGAPMWTWLDADLASNAQEWVVAFWHHPPYSKGSHDSDTESELIEMRENFLPRLEDAGVDLVLSGHSHSYERSFLIDGHYGLGSSFTASMKKSNGDGDPEGDGAYNRLNGPHRGAIYVVAGSSSRIVTNVDLDHPAMLRGLARFGSVVIDVAGGRMDVTFLGGNGAILDRFTLLNESFEGAYCVAAADSAGCVAEMSSTGTASASDPVPFLVRANFVRPSAFGLLYYGFRPGASPFSNGVRCVGGAVRRTLVQNSGGSAGNCDGAYAFDFNARIQSGFDGALVAGRTIYSQYWFRDLPSASGTAVSDALQFVIQP